MTIRSLSKITVAALANAALFTLSTPNVEAGFWDFFKKKSKPCEKS